MAKVKKPSIHAPWRKRTLVTLWVFQLFLAVFQFVWSTTFFYIGIGHGSDTGLTSYEKASLGVTMILGLSITIGIIITIVRFSKFRLLTYDFQFRSIYVVILGIVSLAFVFSASDYFTGIFVALQLFFSIWLMVYAVLVRKRVLSGNAQEMKRPLKDAAEVQPDIELGRTATNPMEPPPSYHAPSHERLGSNGIMHSAPETIRPSQSSATSFDERGAPSKETREFV